MGQPAITKAAAFADDNVVRNKAINDSRFSPGNNNMLTAFRGQRSPAGRLVVVQAATGELQSQLGKRNVFSVTAQQAARR